MNIIMNMIQCAMADAGYHLSSSMNSSGWTSLFYAVDNNKNDNRYASVWSTDTRIHVTCSSRVSGIPLSWELFNTIDPNFKIEQVVKFITDWLDNES